MIEWDVFENDDRMFAWILFEKSLEVWTACWQNHLMSFACLTVTSQCNLQEVCWIMVITNISTYICEAFFISQVFEWWHHVVLEVIPFQEKLLFAHICFLNCYNKNYKSKKVSASKFHLKEKTLKKLGNIFM